MARHLCFLRPIPAVELLLAGHQRHGPRADSRDVFVRFAEVVDDFERRVVCRKRHSARPASRQDEDVVDLMSILVGERGQVRNVRDDADVPCHAREVLGGAPNAIVKDCRAETGRNAKEFDYAFRIGRILCREGVDVLREPFVLEGYACGLDLEARSRENCNWLAHGHAHN